MKNIKILLSLLLLTSSNLIAKENTKKISIKHKHSIIKPKKNIEISKNLPILKYLKNEIGKKNILSKDKTIELFKKIKQIKLKKPSKKLEYYRKIINKNLKRYDVLINDLDTNNKIDKFIESEINKVIKKLEKLKKEKKYKEMKEVINDNLYIKNLNDKLFKKVKVFKSYIKQK